MNVLYTIDNIPPDISAQSESFENVTASKPEGYALKQNYPNPFNPVTKLGFGISELGFVSLKVYDILGYEIANFVNESINAGSYEVKFDGRNLPSGIYFYSLIVNGREIDTKRLLLVK